MLCEEKFFQTYHKQPLDIAFCPYRVCPIGAHIDHQKGKVTGFAIDKGIHIAYAPKMNGVIELSSLQFPKRAQWHVRAVSETREGDWADYLRGVTIELGQRYPLTVGMSGVIEGSLPIGGLSSSAAVCISFLSALCKLNGINLTDMEAVSIAKAAENNYVGVSCGKLDQCCEILSKAGHLLYLDTLDDSYELIPCSPSAIPHDIVIFFSGVERSLAGSAFNMRVDECKAAAYALRAYAGMEYGKFKEEALRDIPKDVFEAYKDRLPEPWRLRAEHYFGEMARVEAGAEAFRRGDMETYGRLSFESGASSINIWQSGSPELKAIYEAMTRTEGILGGRFSGAGFKGCCMALVDTRYTESAIRSVTESYLKEFPVMQGKFSAHVCHSADGVKI